MTANGCGRHGRWRTGCPDCQRISRAYERKRRTAKQNGTWKPLVPREQVQAHLDQLLEGGANIAGIAAAAGLSARTVYGVRHRTWVQGETAAAILAVQHAHPLPPAGMVSAVGACRRIRALTAIGWPLTEQARQLGMFLQQVCLIAAGKQSAVTNSTDAAVRALFERLWATPGPSTRARNDAHRKGWVPPLAWDDVDDPGAEPALGESRDDIVDEVAVERALAGHAVELTDAELVATLQAGVGRGEPLSKLADRFGVNYWGARRMVGGDLTPRRALQQRIEAELRRVGDKMPDSTIAALLGVHHQTVSRARARLARVSARSEVA